MRAEEADRIRKLSASPGGKRTPAKLSFINKSPKTGKSPIHTPNKLS